MPVDRASLERVGFLVVRGPVSMPLLMGPCARLSPRRVVLEPGLPWQAPQVCLGPTLTCPHLTFQLELPTLST